MRGERGFTLAEVILGSGLSALLLAVVLGLLIPVLRQGNQTYLRLERGQRVMRVLRSLQADLGRTAPGGLLEPASPAEGSWLVIQPLQGLAQGSPQWQSRWLVYARGADHRLRRLDHDPSLTDVSRPRLPSPAERAGLLAGPAARVLAADVASLSVRRAEGSSLVTAELRLEGEPPLTVRTSFHLRSPGL